MSDPFVGEVRMFSGNFAPLGWAFCNGAVLPISQNTALFSLLGINYGGDGHTTFALPNLQGAFPIHAGGSGAGPGLSPRSVGETGGSETVTLTSAQLPTHGHGMEAVSAATTGTPGSSVSLAPTSNGSALYRAPDIYLNTAPSDMGASGGNGAHNNLPPYLTVSFIIALQGIFPPRS